MKDPIRHLKHTQRKVIQSVRKTKDVPEVTVWNQNGNGVQKNKKMSSTW